MDNLSAGLESPGRINSASIKNFHTARNNTCRVSIASAPACQEASGRPPTSLSNSSLPISRAKFTLLSFANSVIADPHAIVGTHPLARNRMSAIRSPSAQTQLQNVATGGIFQPRGGIRFFHDSRVARILEMIEQFARIHKSDCNGLTFWQAAQFDRSAFRLRRVFARRPRMDRCLVSTHPVGSRACSPAPRSYWRELARWIAWLPARNTARMLYQNSRAVRGESSLTRGPLRLRRFLRSSPIL